ncbi:MAG: DegT/DnrJ/EryC1/StrS family aminotransferase [Fimbriimonadaceae bacterium]|nr:DegT/DnrJ/EryC1/StrS family aminotransferase [Fimbriimonadaceae bacterium]
MAAPFMDQAELALLQAVIASQELWRGLAGNFAVRFESAFAEHLGRSFCHGVSAGTAANECALFGLGLQPGDEVICPASAPAFVSLPVVSLGCVPVFADCDPRTLLLSPEGLEAAITPRAKAVMIVHLMGQVAPLDDLLAVARRHGLRVHEDCAQAYDATWRGRPVGTFGDSAAFSLQQSKHITTGEGGLVLSDDAEVYRRAVTFSNSGLAWYQYGLDRPTAAPLGDVRTRGHFSFGHNYRLSELAAAVGLAQLAKLATFNARRRELVAALEDELRDVPGIGLAQPGPHTGPNYWTYPLQVPDGLGTYAEVNYCEPVFQQMQADRRTSLGIPLPDYVQYVPGACPMAEAGARRMRPISVHHGLDVAQIRTAAQAVRAAVAG